MAFTPLGESGFWGSTTGFAVANPYAASRNVSSPKHVILRQ